MVLLHGRIVDVVSHDDHDVDKESVRVLRECIDLQSKKASDYQNPTSSVRQAMHYRRGVGTIYDMIWQKALRARSILEAYENDVNYEIKNESLEDTFKDIINYASFAVAYMRRRMEGQDQYAALDILNRPLIDVKEGFPAKFHDQPERGG